MKGSELTNRAHIDVSSTGRVAAIDQNIYGQFLESAFFGNIEGGVLDEGSPFSIQGGVLDGCREDVLDACRALGIPVLRWPGGNFTSPYRWEDGIGPRDERPRRLELAWGTEESNRFGTPEFLAWCDAVGAEPYLAHSCRSVDDAVRWVEYTNYAGTTEYTKKRAADGHAEPYGVKLWGLGNEVYGPWQMGVRSAERYVEDAREHARFMRAVDPTLRFIAVGWEQEAWTETVVNGLADRVDYFSLHLYGTSHHLSDPSVAEFDAIVAQPLFFERSIVDYSQRISRAAARMGVKHPLGIAMDEWNLRHLEPASWPEPQPGPDGGFAERDIDATAENGKLRVNRYSQRTLADALFYAGVFHAMHRAAKLETPVSMANTVNLINANGIINVREGGIVRTPNYYVWDLYQNHFGGTALETSLTAPSAFRNVRIGANKLDARGNFLTTPAAVSLLDVSSSLSDDRRSVSVVAINRSATEDISAQITLDGRTSKLPGRAAMRSIGADADDLFSTNTIGDPDRVVLTEERSVELDNGEYVFPAHSITALTFSLDGPL